MRKSRGFACGKKTEGREEVNGVGGNEERIGNESNQKAQNC